jgi:hypothetical protein
MKKKSTTTIYPPGWDYKRVAAIAKFYDDQSDKDIALEIDAAAADPDTVMVQVPRELLPAVLKLIDKRKKSA